MYLLVGLACLAGPFALQQVQQAISAFYPFTALHLASAHTRDSYRRVSGPCVNPSWKIAVIRLLLPADMPIAECGGKRL